MKITKAARVTPSPFSILNLTWWMFWKHNTLRVITVVYQILLKNNWPYLSYAFPNTNGKWQLASSQSPLPLLLYTNTHPPSKSVLSLCWFILMTFNLWPVNSDKYCTVDVLPVPVSPTNNTASFLAMQAATLSTRTRAGLVYAKLEVCRLSKLQKCKSFKFSKLFALFLPKSWCY